MPVLMELFARDHDLVRQAIESAKMKKVNAPGSDQNQPRQVASQHPMRMGSQTRLAKPQIALNSWPHFSSISSLNNLGTMHGVKSITSTSGADLASQGNLNKMRNLAYKMGNLAQVKSVEFTGKREREEDNDVGLSLNADEPPSATISTKSKIPRRSCDLSKSIRTG
jgi:hypothetical protein